MLEIKNTNRKKNASAGLTGGPDTAEERVTELEDVKQKRQNCKAETEETVSKDWCNYRRCVICVVELQKPKRKRKEQVQYLKQHEPRIFPD